MRRWFITAVVAAATVGLVTTSVAQAKQLSPWGDDEKIDTVGGNSSELNTPFADGCPIQSPDGLRLFMASNRPGPGALGGLDIWVAERDDVDAPFGAPRNLGAPINSAFDDFCPTPVRGDGLFFVSRRPADDACGLGDIYFTRRNPVHGWDAPHHLACAPAGPNSALDEQGPSFVDTDEGELLYFSRSASGVPGDIFVSARGADGEFGTAAAVSELNTAGNEIQPNVRKDGLEVVFSSNHAHPGALGGQDLYVASRASTADAWSAPVNIGPAVNTTADESRPSLSWDAQTLLFGRAPGPEGGSDIFLTTREKVTGSNR